MADASRMLGWRHRLIIEERRRTPRQRRALLVLAAALVAVGVVSFASLLVAVLAADGPLPIDQAVDDWLDERRSGELTSASTVLALGFGPVGMPVVVAVALTVWIWRSRHLWRPLLIAGGMLVGVALALTIAPLVQRARPPVAEMLLGVDRSSSFPSGHVLGMSDFLLLAAFLLASRIGSRAFAIAATVGAIALVVAQAASRLYLGYHWLTDVSASVALSLVVVGTIVAVDTHRTVRLAGERIDGAPSTPQRDGT